MALPDGKSSWGTLVNPKWGLWIASSLGSPVGSGWVCLAGCWALSPHPTLNAGQDIWRISHFNFSLGQGPWALAHCCPVAVALALTWWPGEQEVSS